MSAGHKEGGKRGRGTWRTDVLGGFAKDESGMTMGLVVIMIVLIGVMGAGLLAFVSTDLNTVVEVNQGQRAFEMADAGVQAARKQLRDKDPDPKHYGGSDGATGDIDWTQGNGKTLYMSGSSDQVKVKIQSNTPSAGYFTATSTGQAGDARRKIEAVLYSTASAAGGGIPAWYTPGGMRIKKDALASGVSFFAGENIVLRPGSGTGPGEDILEEWYRPPFNTTPRTDSSGNPYKKAGVASEKRVLCSSTDTGAGSVCGSSETDGIRYYDSTTTPKFVERMPTAEPQPANEITYPFSREVNVDGLLEKAKSGSPNLYLPSAGSDIPESTEKRVVFVDAGGGTVDFNKGATFNGVLVIRCGDLNVDKEGTFNGIVIAIKGTGAGCSTTGKINFKKTLSINGTVYADSEDDRSIDDDKGVNAGRLPDGYDDFSRLAFVSSVEIVSWRELYQ